MGKKEEGREFSFNAMQTFKIYHSSPEFLISLNKNI